MNEEQLKTYNKLPPPGSSHLIDFDRASAIRTKHLTNIGGPALVKGPLQTYDVLSLRGIANQAD